MNKSAAESAIRALKWFVGRQERGRVQSQFSVWVFKVTIEAAELLLNEKVEFDFDTYDATMSKAFEISTGMTIHRENRN
jgi:hypothetical protein